MYIYNYPHPSPFPLILSSYNVSVVRCEAKSQLNVICIYIY